MHSLKKKSFLKKWGVNKLTSFYPLLFWFSRGQEFTSFVEFLEEVKKRLWKWFSLMYLADIFSLLSSLNIALSKMLLLSIKSRKSIWRFVLPIIIVVIWCLYSICCSEHILFFIIYASEPSMWWYSWSHLIDEETSQRAVTCPGHIVVSTSPGVLSRMFLLNPGYFLSCHAYSLTSGCKHYSLKVSLPWHHSRVWYTAVKKIGRSLPWQRTVISSKHKRVTSA